MKATWMGWVAAVALGVGLAAVPAAASIILVDLNAVAEFELSDPPGESEPGMTVWTVDGTNHMYQQWFWYRVGDAGPEVSIDTLPLDFSLTSDTNADGDHDTLYARYKGADVQVEVTFVLAGSPAGSGMSDIAEIIRITNLTDTTMPFHFFEYCDFDLNESIIDQSVEIRGGNTAVQMDANIYVAETVVTTSPDHYQVAEYSEIWDNLEDGGPTTLTDDAGPLEDLDATWAFQWDNEIKPGRTLLISKDKNFVPEPATLVLLVAGGALLLVGRRRALAR